MKRLLVVGAGIAGLSGARAALAEATSRRMALDVIVAEASGRVGGQIHTDLSTGVPLEWGPDGFVASRPELTALCEALGLQTIGSGVTSATAYLRRGSHLRPLPPGLVMGVPTGLGPLLRSVTGGLVGPAAAARAALEPLLPRGGAGGTVREVANRRLGAGVTDALVAPIVHGIFGAAPEHVAADMVPGLTDGRSLLWRAVRGRGGGPSFRTVLGGMASLPQSLTASMPSMELLLRRSVRALELRSGRWHAEIGDDVLVVDAVLVTTTPAHAGMLLAHAVPQVGALALVTAPTTVMVHLAWPIGTLGRPLHGGGYLTDPRDEPVVSAATFVTTKWPHLGSAPRVRASITRRDLLQAHDDAELGAMAASDLEVVLDARAAPTEILVHRWKARAPAPSPATRGLTATLRRSLPVTAAVAGTASGALGLPDCVRSGTRAGRLLVAALADG